MLLKIRHLGEDEHFPDQLLFNFEKFTYQDWLDYTHQGIRRGMSDIARKTIKYESKSRFRGTTIYKKLVKKDRVFVRLPFAGDKTVCFWLPGFNRPGIAIVISPSAALMHDRDKAVQLQYRFNDSATIGVQPEDEDRKVLCTDIYLGKLRVLYMNPESLRIKDFPNKLKQIIGKTPVGLTVIDACHCISEWSRDFRPEYLKIPSVLDSLKKIYPELTLIGLTAHSGMNINQDISHRLGLTEIELGDTMYRCNVSLQTLPVESSVEKKRVFDRILNQDLPAALHCQNFHDIFINQETTGAAFCIFADSDKSHNRSDNVSFYLNETQKFLTAHRVVNSDAFSKEKMKRLESIDRYQWPDFLYSCSNKYDDIYVQMNLPGPSIMTPKSAPDSHNEKIRFVIHTAMSDSIHSWCREIGRAGNDGKRAHCVQIVILPTPSCEEDMSRRQTDIPICTENGCPFGYPEICDFGWQHLTIRNHTPDALSDVIRSLNILNRLVAGAKAGNTPCVIECPLASEKETELAIYRLWLLDVITGYDVVYKDDLAIFEIAGFSDDVAEKMIRQKALQFLIQHAINGNRMDSHLAEDRFTEPNGEIQKCMEKYGERLQQAIRAEVESGAWTWASSYASLFNLVGRYMLVILDFLYDLHRMMRYRSLWNLKEFMKSKSCRYAMLLKHLQAIDERWECHLCDNCFPDLKFLAESRCPPASKKIQELEEAFKEWVDNANVGFEIASADQIKQNFSNFPANIYFYSSNLLEQSPMNIKALYLVREFSPESLKAKTSLDLMRIACHHIRMEAVQHIYKTSPDHPDIRKSQFELLDDEYGIFNSLQGIEWLFHEAKTLPIEPERLTALSTRLFLMKFKQTDFSLIHSRLNQLAGEI